MSTRTRIHFSCTRFLCATLVTSLTALCAAAERDEQTTAAVTLRGNWFTGQEYSIGGSEFRRIPGLLGRDTTLAVHLRAHRPSIRLYVDSQRLSVASVSLTGIGAVMVVVAVVVGNQQGDIRWPVIYAAALPVSVGLYLDFLGSRKLNAAVSVFNTNLRIGHSN